MAARQALLLEDTAACSEERVQEHEEWQPHRKLPGEAVPQPLTMAEPHRVVPQL